MTGDRGLAGRADAAQVRRGLHPAPEAYTLLGKAGVNTVVQIGCTPVHARAAREAGVTIVRVPHAACDNIGINLLLDAVEEIGTARSR